MTPLHGYKLLRVTGEDRFAFLQGQLTCDLRTLVPGRFALAGWTDPKGRLLMISRVWVESDTCMLLLPAALADAVMARLRMYVLRARVKLEFDTDHEAWSDAHGADTEDAPATDPASRLSGPGPELAIRSYSGAASQSGIAADWKLALIRAGIGEVLPATAGEFLPSSLNLDLLGGVSLDKGCYVGQEIIARMHFRGRIRRRMLRFATGGPEPEPGMRVVDDSGRAAGHVVLGAPAGEDQTELLAEVPLDAIGQVLRLADDRNTELRPLDLPYPLPEVDRNQRT